MTNLKDEVIEVTEFENKPEVIEIENKPKKT
jgi:hypothetical protein